MHWAVEVEFLLPACGCPFPECLHDRLPCSWGLALFQRDSGWVRFTSQVMSWGSQALAGHSPHGGLIRMSTQPSGPARASLQPGFLGRVCTSLCKNFLRHKILEGLMVPLGPDSSPSPNLRLRNTASILSIHSAPVLSIGCSPLSLSAPHAFSPQVLPAPPPSISQSVHIPLPPHPVVITSHLNAAAELPLLSRPRSSRTL